MLAMFEGGYIGLRQFKPVMEELRKPSFEDFSGKMTVWSLFNRITTACGPGPDSVRSSTPRRRARSSAFSTT